MTIADRLRSLKARVMNEIGEAARKHDTRRIDMLSKLASRIEEDERVLSGVEQHVVEYQKEISGTKPPSIPPPSAGGTQQYSRKGSGGVSKRTEGRDARRKFVDALQRRGIQLIHLGGKIYRTPGGRRVGIPFANELEDKPDRWFLGLKDGNYDAVVLLCSQGDGETLEFILPRDFLRGFWSSLSRNAGEVKFNLVRDGANYYLLVPPQRRESVNRFLSVYQTLKD